MLEVTGKSAPFSLNRNDLTKLLKSAILSSVAVAITVFLRDVAEWDLGEWTPAVTATAAVLANLVHKFVR